MMNDESISAMELRTLRFTLLLRMRSSIAAIWLQLALTDFYSRLRRFLTHSLFILHHFPPFILHHSSFIILILSACSLTPVAANPPPDRLYVFDVSDWHINH